MQINDEVKPYKPKKENKPSIRLYKWGDMVRCELNGKIYWTAMGYLRQFIYTGRKFCYLTEWYSDEERKAFLEKRDAEFKEKVRQSLRQKLKG